MEKQKATSKSKNKILKFLPRATSSVSFQNPPPYSPAKDKRSSEKPHKSHLGIGFSGPMVSTIRAESRRKSKNDSTYTTVYEPTSPRVSCMGQVKCKHYQKKLAAARGLAGKPLPVAGKVSRATSFTAVRTYNNEDDHEKVSKPDAVAGKSKKKLGFGSILGAGAGRSGRKSDETDNKSTVALKLEKAPSLGMMKRFSSGRDAFLNFDWTTQVAPVESDHRNYYSDDERGGREGDEEVKIPSSVPVVTRNKVICDNFSRVGGINLEPKKEINLWKRRTMPQPKPLQLLV